MLLFLIFADVVMHTRQTQNFLNLNPHIMKRFLSLLLTCLAITGSSWAQALPYNIDFSSSREGWTTIDKSEVPGKTWVFKNKAAYIRGNYYDAVTTETDYSSTADDYFVSPAFTLKANTVYTLKSTALKTQGITVEIGTSATDAASFKVLGDIVCDNDYNYSFEPEVLEFEVSTDGTYYIAYHGTTEMYQPYPAGYLFAMELTEDNGGGVEDNSPEDVPYSINFNESTSKWTAADNNNDGSTWTSAFAGYGVTIDNIYSYDDDFISPAFNVKDGQKYKISTQCTVDYGTNDELSLLVNDGDGTFKEIYRYALNTGENNNEISYTAASALCQFAFRIVKSDAAEYSNQVCLYKFAIEEDNSGSTDGKAVLDTDFTGTNPMEGWTVIDANGDNISWGTWESVPGITYDGESAAGAADDWAITPELNIADGQNYMVEILFKQSGAFGADNVEIAYGSAATAETMTGLIADTNLEFEYGFGEKSLSLLMSGNGSNKYIGLHINTSEPNGKLTVASIKVTPVDSPTPCAAENFTAVSDHNLGCVNMSWKNPATDTNGAEISLPMSANIYENDVLVAKVEDMKAGGNGEYAYYPANFAGIATYAVKMCIGNNESAAASQTVNLDDLQGELILIKSFRDVNKTNSADWAVESKSGKFKWEYDYPTVFRFNYGGFGASDEDDWLISPSFSLEYGQRYIVKYNLKTSRDYSSSIDVCLGTAQNSESMDVVLNSHKDLKQNGFGEFETAQFTVDASGDYNIGFHIYDAGYAVSMRYLEIYAVAEATDIHDAAENDIYYDAEASTLYMPGENYTAEVYDMQGMLVGRYSVDGTVLNLSELNDGVYCVVVSSPAGVKNSFKFVK